MSVRLSTIEAISSDGVEIGRNDSGQGLSAAHRLAVHLPGKKNAIVVPEFGMRNDESREPFQLALMSAWTAAA